jgi:chromosome segregation ATPase
LRTFHESLIEAEIRLIEANSELNALRAENSTILERLNRKQAEIQDMDNRNKVRRNEYKQFAARAQQDLDGLSPEEIILVNEYREYASLEELEVQVHAVTARLGMMVAGNSGIIRTYEERKEKIERTLAKLEEHTADLEDTKAKITEIRGQWEPELDTLVAKISDAFAHNFSQIGCAGEVQVYKDEEDFDKWSIQVSVRFR